MGTDIEKEHLDDVPARTEIAKDHLEEDSKYYTHLREMEKKYAAEETDSSSPYRPLKEGVLGLTTPFSWTGPPDFGRTSGLLLSMASVLPAVKRGLGDLVSRYSKNRELSPEKSRILIKKLISEGAQQTGKRELPSYFSLEELLRPAADSWHTSLQQYLARQFSRSPALYARTPLFSEDLAKKLGLRSREFILSHGGNPAEVLAHEVGHAYPKGLLEKLLAQSSLLLSVPSRIAPLGAIGLGLHGVLTSDKEKESLPWTMKAAPWVGALPFVNTVPEELRASLRGRAYLKSLGVNTRGAGKVLSLALAHHAARTLPVALGSLGAYLALKQYHNKKHQEWLNSSVAKSTSASKKIASEVLDTVKVVHVNGNEARKKNIEFALGGNHYRYNFIPKDEVWLEHPTKNKNDQIANTTHEIVERLLCKEKGMSYEPAHEIASKVERTLRSTLEKQAAEKIEFPDYDRHKYLKLFVLLLPLTAGVRGMGATVRAAARAKAKTFPWRDVPMNILKGSPEAALSALLGGGLIDRLVNKEILGQREGVKFSAITSRRPPRAL